jgi:hypothetical protein
VVLDGWVAKLRRSVTAGGAGATSGAPSDGVFVIGDTPPATREQQERLWWLVRRGKRSLLIGSALMFGALVIAMARGTAPWSYWLIPLVALVIAGAFELIDRRLSRHPPGSVEVPADLADLIVELYQTRDEIVIYGPDRLPPDEYERVVGLVRGHVAQIVAAATRLLVVERAGDRDASTALRADIEARVEAVMEVYEALDEREGVVESIENDNSLNTE